MSVEYPKEAVRFDHRLPKRDVHKKFKLDDRIEVQLVTVANAINYSNSMLSFQFLCLGGKPA